MSAAFMALAQSSLFATSDSVAVLITLRFGLARKLGVPRAASPGPIARIRIFLATPSTVNTPLMETTPLVALALPAVSPRGLSALTINGAGLLVTEPAA